jgi:hypothetical protein
MSTDRPDLFSWSQGQPPGTVSTNGGEAARDAALAQVSRPDFMGRYLMFCRSLPAGALVTGEDISLACARAGIIPHHANAWGAAANMALKRGLLIDTGQRAKMRKRASHARQTPVYRVP